jgi:hypothetical protein
MRFTPWTPAEDAIVIKHAESMQAKEIAEQLPGRTTNAVFHRKIRLGLITNRRWTKRDDEQLAMLWGTPMWKFTKLIGRTQATTYWRAQKLGLGLGVPAGMESVSTCARRCGFSPTTMRRVLAWEGVELKRSVTRKDRQVHKSWVDPFDADRAVEKWLKTETVEAASRRIGTTPERLLGRLLASGLALPARTPGRRHWRVPSATIDEAVRIVRKIGKRLVVA